MPTWWCSRIRRCAASAEAGKITHALSPENGDHIRVEVEGAMVHAEAAAASPLALLHTLDDALACLGAAQRSASLGQKKE